VCLQFLTANECYYVGKVEPMYHNKGIKRQTERSLGGGDKSLVIHAAVITIQHTPGIFQCTRNYCCHMAHGSVMHSY
jgi:hypothetical protein